MKEIRDAFTKGYRVTISPGGSDTGDSGGPVKIRVDYTKWHLVEGLTTIHYAFQASCKWSDVHRTIAWLSHRIGGVMTLYAATTNDEYTSPCDTVEEAIDLALTEWADDSEPGMEFPERLLVDVCVCNERGLSDYVNADTLVEHLWERACNEAPEFWDPLHAHRKRHRSWTFTDEMKAAIERLGLRIQEAVEGFETEMALSRFWVAGATWEVEVELAGDWDRWQWQHSGDWPDFTEETP